MLLWLTMLLRKSFACKYGTYVFDDGEVMHPFSLIEIAVSGTLSPPPGVTLHHCCKLGI